MSGDFDDDERLGCPSASAWGRFSSCLASFQMTQKARELGQLAHERSVSAQSGLRKHLGIEGKPVELSEAEARTVEFHRELEREQIDRIFEGRPVQTVREHRYWLSVSGKRALSGRVDLCVWDADTALVIDHKTGFSEPDPAQDDAQLRVLAVLIAIDLPKIKEVIVQKISMYGVSERRYNMLEILVAYKDILRILDAIRDPDAPFNPTPENCRYCGAVNICGAVKNLVMPVAGQVAPLPDGERAAKLLDEVELLQNHLDSVREYYGARMTRDPSYAIPGYVLKPGNATREVTDWEAALERLKGHLEPKDLNGAAAYRLSPLERALARRFKLKAKEASEKLNEILAGLIEYKQCKPTLKRVRGEPRVNTLEPPHERANALPGDPYPGLDF